MFKLLVIFTFALLCSPNNAYANSLELFKSLSTHFTFSHYALEQRYVFFWHPPANGTIKMAIAAKTHGWIGVGWNQEGTQMVGSTACIAFSDNNELNVYNLMSQQLSGIVRISSANIVNASVHFSIVEEYTAVNFTWNITLPNPVFDPYDEIAMVFAYSDSPTLSATGHANNATTTAIQLTDGGGSNRFYPCDSACSGHGICDPISCACVDDWYGVYCGEYDTWNVRGAAMVHGIMMYLAFGFMYPLGMAWARYAQDGTRGWYTTHQTIQGTTSMFLIAAIILALVLVWSSDEIRAMVESTWHPPLGFIIIGLVFVQLIFAIFRPQHRPNNPKTACRQLFEVFHSWVGRFLILFGWVNCYFGIRALGIDIAFVYVHFGVIIMWVAMLVLLETRKRCGVSVGAQYARVP